ncbi:MAG: hypothetical protein B7Y36_02820 [Novosphingobium sp. 28-62-57]|uniref:hypothetical protein n=1 Tax=Novosphingobium sp. 28-62-57 TaxID=1970409 RepID=UPI000BC9145F|nr:hypothetical protein [Novosphingobium sp. 28-62-57]OYW49583.1 MAG: hypothetical protein B7Z34_07790 [Novosphingobium sp. 12-62-10]OYZ12461.1 MAG: hypothetical protein B7Y36_02820 [Novosphingobium sp. 28-62-57]OZA31033.1 MAG: hypothetical protein B7X92_15305 [Novosphingobium sp. 17-62-9]
MTHRTLAAIAMLFIASTAQAVPGGKLMTVQKGPWTCEIPGDANTLAVEKPELGFEAIADSSYVAPDGTTGSYLRLADRLTLTSGVFAGRRFVMDGEEILRELAADDKPLGLRCVHAGPIRIATPG